MSEQAKCGLCGEPLPPGEEMFKYHGYSCECPKPPLPRTSDPAEKLRTLELAWVDKIADDYNTLETELHKIVDFIEPHWKGAGAKLEAEWIIAAIGKLCSERDAFERSNDAMRGWLPIETIPQELKDGRGVLALIPCYGYYNEIGKLRGYLQAIVEWRYGQWNEVGIGKRELAYFMEIPPAPGIKDNEDASPSLPR